MNFSANIFLVSLVCFGVSAHAHDHEKHAHSAHAAPKAAAAAISGKSLYNIQSKWYDVDNKRTDLKSLGGQPRLVTMLYTSCTSACPMLVDKMKGVVNSLSESEKAKLKMALFSFDPRRDTPKHLKGFAQKQSLNLQNWTLLSPVQEADSTELANALGVQFKKVKDDYIHSNVIFLLDGNGELVASDEGLGKARSQFIAEVKKLLGAR